MKKIILSLALFFSTLGCSDFGNHETKKTTSTFLESSWIGEKFSGFSEYKAIHGKNFMISTSEKLASEAGAKILESGGNAVDAAIAAQMVLNVVEPQSSGIGGGLFLLYYDAKHKRSSYFNGRETAPAKANENIFLDKNGKVRDFYDVVGGGLSVGTPGALKALKQAHQKYGKLPWKDLFAPAIKIANDGFPLGEKIYVILKQLPYLNRFDGMKIYFNTDGSPKKPGTIITNPDLAKTFEIIANQGIKPFYEGKIAKDIVNAVQNSKENPGYLSLADLKSYQTKSGELLCGTYRLKYKICSMPLPSSGGITILETLGILENFDLSKLKPSSAEAIHLISEATRLAYADRNEYAADMPNVPVKQMLDKKYLKQRASLIKMDTVMTDVKPGLFKKSVNTDKTLEPASNLAAPSLKWQIHEQRSAAYLTYVSSEAQGIRHLRPAQVGIGSRFLEKPSTTHLSIIDKDGNAVSMTSSIEYLFGSVLMVDGFMLNNQLTDFSLAPEINGKKVANRVQPLKQPRSSMSPTFIFDDKDNLIMVIGSPGGPRIIQFVLKTIIGHLDFGLDIQEAISLPNHVILNDRIELEDRTKLKKLKPILEKMGHKVVITDITSGLQGITIDANGFKGGADPRRRAVAIGR